MKGFLLKSFLTAIPLLLVALTMETALRHIPNDYDYKKSYLDRHAAEIETLILGSSQEYYGLNPDFFTENAFNACHVSQGYDMDLAILKKYSNELKSLKTIILPISYTSISMDIEHSPESWRYKNYSIYYGIDRWRLNNGLELTAMKQSVNLKRLRDHYIDGKNEISCSDKGWGEGFAVERSTPPEKTVGNVRRHTIDNELKLKEIAKHNRNEIKEIVEIAQKLGAEIILFATPVSTAYRNARNSEQLSAARSAASFFAANYSFCRILDLSDDPRFEDSDFFDADHLNDAGARKLSQIVDQWTNLR